MSAVRSWLTHVMWRGAAPACALLALTAGPAAAQDPGPNLFTTIGITTEETRDNSGIRGPYSLQAEDMPPSRSVLAPEDDVTDDVPLRMPDTSGNLPNLAAFDGQALALAADDRKAYTRIHFFGMTADGSGGGDFLLTYTDGSTQTVAVSFPDWCQSGHWAIGPGNGRWTPTGSDTAPCGIFHVPAEIDEGKTLASVQLPPETDAGGNTVAYLMALTLEQPDGSFELPDLSGRAPCVDEDVAPVTTHAFSPAAPNGNDGWYAGAVRATLSATDEEGGSGVEQVLYRLDGGRARPYGGVLTLDADGPHTFEYRAIDCAGNAEEFKSVDLKVDAHAPSTAARLTPRTPLGPGGWYDGAVAVALTARDGDGSGTDVTEYRLDGGSWTAYEGALEIGAVGRHVLEYRSTDVAGNVEPARALDVNVDATAPRTDVLGERRPRAGRLRRRRAGGVRPHGRRRVGGRRDRVPAGRRRVDRVRRRLRRRERGGPSRRLPLARRRRQHGAVSHPPVQPERAGRPVGHAAVASGAVRGARPGGAEPLDARRAPARPAGRARELPERPARHRDADRHAGDGAQARAREPRPGAGRGALRRAGTRRGAAAPEPRGAARARALAPRCGGRADAAHARRRAG